MFCKIGSDSDLELCTGQKLRLTMSIFRLVSFLFHYGLQLVAIKKIRETDHSVLLLFSQDNMAKMAERIEGDHLGLLEKLE